MRKAWEDKGLLSGIFLTIMMDDPLCIFLPCRATFEYPNGRPSAQVRPIEQFISINSIYTLFSTEWQPYIYSQLEFVQVRQWYQQPLLNDQSFRAQHLSKCQLCWKTSETRLHLIVEMPIREHRKHSSPRAF